MVDEEHLIQYLHKNVTYLYQKSIIYSVRMPKEKEFTEKDKQRIMRSESKKHGEIRDGSFAQKVQKTVDKKNSKKQEFENY